MERLCFDINASQCAIDELLRRQITCCQKSRWCRKFDSFWPIPNSAQSRYNLSRNYSRYKICWQSGWSPPAACWWYLAICSVSCPLLPACPQANCAIVRVGRRRWCRRCNYLCVWMASCLLGNIFARAMQKVSVKEGGTRAEIGPRVSSSYEPLCTNKGRLRWELFSLGRRNWHIGLWVEENFNDKDATTAFY